MTVAKFTTDATEAVVTIGAGGPCAFCLLAMSSRRPNGIRSLKASRIGDVAGREVTSPDGMPAPIVRGGASLVGTEGLREGGGEPGPNITTSVMGRVDADWEDDEGFKPPLVVLPWTCDGDAVPDGDFPVCKTLPVGDGLKAMKDNDCLELDSSGLNSLDELLLVLLLIVLPRVVNTTSGGRTLVDVGVIMVVMYARMTRTVGAFVTVTRYPLWKGSKIVFVGMKSL